MRTAIEITVALLAIVGLCVLVRQGSKSVERNSTLSFWGIFICTFGGFLYDSAYLPRGQTTQLALLGIISIFVLLQLMHNAKTRDPLVGRSLRLTVFMAVLVSFVLFFVNAIQNPDLHLSDSLGRFAGVAYLALVTVFMLLSSPTTILVGRAVVMSVLSVLAIAPLGDDG